MNDSTKTRMLLEFKGHPGYEITQGVYRSFRELLIMEIRTAPTTDKLHHAAYMLKAFELFRCKFEEGPEQAADLEASRQAVVRDQGALPYFDPLAPPVRGDDAFYRELLQNPRTTEELDTLSES